MPKRLLQRFSTWGLMAAVGALAAAFLSLALFLWLEPQLGGPGAALTVAALLGLLAGALHYSTRLQRPPGAPASPHAGGAAVAPSAPSLPGAGEAIALARWAIQERPLIALAVCAGAGYMLVRHPKAVTNALATASKLLGQQLGAVATKAAE